MVIAEQRVQQIQRSCNLVGYQGKMQKIIIIRGDSKIGFMVDYIIIIFTHFDKMCKLLT